MAGYIGSNKQKGAYIGSNKIKAIYKGTTKLWSGGSAVSYYNGSTLIGTVEVEEGKDVLRPSLTFSKSGYTHIGWAKTNGGSVVTSLVATGEPMTLYAVWLKNTATVLSAKVQTIAGTVNPEYVINSYDSAYIADVQYAHAVGSYNYLYSSSDTKSMYVDIGKYQTMTVKAIGGGFGESLTASIDGTSCITAEATKTYSTSRTIELKASGKHSDSGSWHSVICGCTSIVLSNPKKWS